MLCAEIVSLNVCPKPRAIAAMGATILCCARLGKPGAFPAATQPSQQQPTVLKAAIGAEVFKIHRACNRTRVHGGSFESPFGGSFGRPGPAWRRPPSRPTTRRRQGRGLPVDDDSRHRGLAKWHDSTGGLVHASHSSAPILDLLLEGQQNAAHDRERRVAVEM